MDQVKYKASYSRQQASVSAHEINNADHPRPATNYNHLSNLTKRDNRQRTRKMGITSNCVRCDSLSFQVSHDSYLHAAPKTGGGVQKAHLVVAEMQICGVQTSAGGCRT